MTPLGVAAIQPFHDGRFSRSRMNFPSTSGRFPE
jgi:hypothetical protein